ncbi:MAG: RNase adapter RapZ [Actinomycetota bacterium]|nr:RNase adapter RapZ [Actinomycetota bacterium]
MAEFLIIAGYSGAGRSEAAKALDDLGWFVIDNLPSQLIPKVAELATSTGSLTSHVALVVGGEHPDDTLNQIGSLNEVDGINVRVLFLTANEKVLVRRYEETRRRHPYEEIGSLTESISTEMSLLNDLRGSADVEIETSDLNVHQLNKRLVDLFTIESSPSSLQTRIVSFGFKHGVPLDVDLVFDCRFLPNPHWEEGLREKTGEDQPVVDFILDRDIAKQFIVQLGAMLELLMPAYQQEGKSYLSVAIGCTGGKHRSVVIANQTEKILSDLGFKATVTHRDIQK